MAISQGRRLLALESPDPDEVKKSIAALKKDADHIRKCIKANVRDYDSGQASIDEINNIIQKLEQKL